MRTDLQQRRSTEPTGEANARLAAGPCLAGPFSAGPCLTGPSFKCPLPFPFPILLAVSLVLFAAAALVRAQTPPDQTPAPASPPVNKLSNHHQRPSPAKQLTVPVQPVPEAVTPPVPETPKWPAFDKPNLASVVWDSHGLSIDASNSSLEQILKDVSAATGAKVDGLTADQRVFGEYGPGQARDVLSQLLQGSGYNVLMIGDQGKGSPKQILLSIRQAGATQPVARNNAATAMKTTLRNSLHPRSRCKCVPAFHLERRRVPHSRLSKRWSSGGNRCSSNSSSSRARHRSSSRVSRRNSRRRILSNRLVFVGSLEK
jgi:hypothetical protein